MYDTLYQQWIEAKRSKRYEEADRLRDDFERLHGLTIFAEGECVIEGVTVRRMTLAKWHHKYGNPHLAKLIETEDSKVRKLFPGYKGTAFML